MSELNAERIRLIFAKSFFAVLALFFILNCISFYRIYTLYCDDFAWVLHCDHRFANVAEWFTVGSTHYHINYPGLVSPFLTPNFRPLTAAFFYLASFFHAWTGYRSQLALNYVLFPVVIWAYLQFLKRFTPLTPLARWIVAAAFLASPVWSDVYFYPSLRVHLLECACTLLASLLLPYAASGSLLRRVVHAGIVSSGAVFAHELGIVAPLVVAWTHYRVTSRTAGSRKKAAMESFLIVAVSLGLYGAVRLAFFHQPAQSGYHAYQDAHGTSPVVAVLGLLLRLFFPFDTYVAGEVLLGGHATVISGLMVLVTLVIYVLLAAGLIRFSRYRYDLQTLGASTLIAAAPLVFAVLARQMGILLIYALPLAYLAVQSVISLDIKRLPIRQAGTALLAGAFAIYIGAGVQLFLKARANWDLEARYSRSMQAVLVSAMNGGARHIFLVDDMSGYYGSLAMLQLTARESGVTLVDPMVVNQLSLVKNEDASPAHDSGIQVECRGDVVSIQIELAEGRQFEFTRAEPLMLLALANTSGGRYEFPDVRRTQHRGRLARSSVEEIDLGRKLTFTAPTACSSVGVVGFPGRGRSEPQIFLLGGQQGAQVLN
jgi:hypothetical protein